MPGKPLGNVSLKMSTEYSCIMINIGESPFFLVSHSQEKCRAKYLLTRCKTTNLSLNVGYIKTDTRNMTLFFFLARTDSGQVRELHICFPNVRWITSDWIVVSFFSAVQ